MGRKKLPVKIKHLENNEIMNNVDMFNLMADFLLRLFCVVMEFYHNFLSNGLMNFVLI